MEIFQDSSWRLLIKLQCASDGEVCGTQQRGCNDLGKGPCMRQKDEINVKHRGEGGPGTQTP